MSNYKLADQGQLTIVALFQKALVTMVDVTDILKGLEFAFNDDGQLIVKNAETCQLTQDEIDALTATFEQATVQA